MKLLAILLFPVLVFASGTQPNFAVQIISSCDMSTASCTSIGTNLAQYNDLFIQAVFTGSPVGVLKLQVSSDNVPIANSSNPAANVTHWTDYTGSSHSISASGDFGYDISNTGARWIRLIYTRTSGTGALIATLNAKGI